MGAISAIGKGRAALVRVGRSWPALGRVGGGGDGSDGGYDDGDDERDGAAGADGGVHGRSKHR